MLRTHADDAAVVGGTWHKSKPRLPIFTTAVQNKEPRFPEISLGISASAERVLDTCSCRGECARSHTGPCPNRIGSLAAGSRWPTRFHLIGDRLICTGCREPYDPNKRWAY